VAGSSVTSAQDSQIDYSINVSRHVLFHEAAHALIREFDLPVLGNEETMADAFATVTIAEFMSDDAAAIIHDRVRSWLYEAEESPPVVDDLKGEHELDARRAYRTVCLLYGADPARWGEVINRIDMEEDDAADCSDTAPDIVESWSRVLAPHRNGDVQGNVIIQYGDAEYTEIVDGAGLLDEVASFMEQFTWPRPVVLHFDSCGRERASWNREERRILICDEYFGRFVRQAENIVF